MIPNHSIENNKQFTHAGGNDHLVSFTFLFKAHGKCAYDRIETTGGKCGHVEDTADIFSAAPDMRFAVVFSRRTVPWSQTCQGGNFLSVEFAQFGQICDEHSAGLRANAWSALQDAVFVFEVVIGIDTLSDEPVNFVYLEVKGLDHFSNALFDFWVVDHKQAVRFLSSQIVELTASSDEFGQFICLGRRMCFRCRFDDLSKFCQNSCVDGIGLCVLPHTIGEITNLSRIDNNHWQRGIEQFGCNRAFIAAGSFKDDKSDGVVFKVLTELVIAVRCVRQTGFDEVGTGGDMKGFFCDIDTDIDRFRHGNLPYLQMRTRRTCGKSAVQTAVRACPTGAARIPLCDGLEDLDTIDLSSPAGVGSAHYATLCAGLRSARLATTSFTYETIINHG